MSAQDGAWVEALQAKARAGVGLDDAEIASLSQERNLLALGMVAEAARARRHGQRVTFVRVAEVPIGAAVASPPPAARELRLVGRPSSIEAALEAVRAARAVAGATPVTGFALDELEALCGGDGARLFDTLCRLREAGLAVLLEALVDRLGSERPLEAVARAGLRIARLAFEQETGSDVVAALRRVAAWGPLGSVAYALAPLPRRLDATDPPTGYDDVRRIALARVLVGQVASIQVDWTRCGPKLAQVALLFGADDLDNVPPVDSAALGPRRAVAAEVRRHIQAAALEPVERDGAFRLLAP